jgi:hypothetical protein
LGESSYLALKERKVGVLIYAGEESSLPKSIAVDPDRLFRIPSFYEKWGITKFVDLGEVDRPRLIYVIPPIRQYAIHYSAMLSMAGVQNAKIILNKTDRETYLGEIKNSAARLVSRFSAHPDYVVVGYTHPWKEILNPIGEDKSLSEGGIDGTLFDIPAQPGFPKPTRILLISSNQTLWGEATSSLVSGTLDSLPEAVLFMGSAGGPSEKAHLYDLSIPSEFRTYNGKTVPIKNFLRKFKKNLPPLVHGNSNSPAEQTLSLVDNWIDHGVDTIDVEQSLVAKTIADFDRNMHAHIEFGAANLITDLPASSRLGQRTENDLDRVDPVLKKKTRERIVQTVFSSIKANLQMKGALSCDGLLMKADLK